MPSTMKRIWTLVVILALAASALAGAGIAAPQTSLAAGCTVGTSPGLCSDIDVADTAVTNGWANSPVTLFFKESNGANGGLAGVFGSVDDPQCTQPASYVYPVPHCDHYDTDATYYDQTYPVSYGTGPIVSSEGNHTFYFFGWDGIESGSGGYEGARHTFSFGIDLTPPAVTPVLKNGSGCGSTYTPGTWSDTPVCVHWNISDPTSNGVSSGIDTTKTNCPDKTISTSTVFATTTTVSCTAYDVADNSTTKSSGTIMVDQFSPLVTCIGAPPDKSVQYFSDVTYSCTATDFGSGLANPSADSSFTLSTNVGNTYTTNAFTNSRRICDVAGNCTPVNPLGPYKVDNTKPSVSCTPSTGAVAPPAWNGADVTEICAPSDPNGPGLAGGTPNPFILSTTAGLDIEGSAMTNHRQVCDVDGSCVTAGPFTFNVDQKAPTFSCSPQQTGVNVSGVMWYGSNVTDSCTAQDGGSGLSAGCRSWPDPRSRLTPSCSD
jgi:hypothetical protein